MFDNAVEGSNYKMMLPKAIKLRMYAEILLIFLWGKDKPCIALLELNFLQDLFIFERNNDPARESVLTLQNRTLSRQQD